MKKYLFLIFTILFLNVSLNAMESVTSELNQKIAEQAEQKIRDAVLGNAFSCDLTNLQKLVDEYGENILLSKASFKNYHMGDINLLHLAGFCGYKPLLIFVQKYKDIFSQLLDEKNSAGETPLLHIALVTGREYINVDEQFRLIIDVNRRRIFLLLAEAGANIDELKSYETRIDSEINKILLQLRAGAILTKKPC